MEKLKQTLLIAGGVLGVSAGFVKLSNYKLEQKPSLKEIISDENPTTQVQIDLKNVFNFNNQYAKNMGILGGIVLLIGVFMPDQSQSSNVKIKIKS